MSVSRTIKIITILLVLGTVAADASAGLFQRRRPVQQVRQSRPAPRQRQVQQSRPAQPRPHRPTLQEHLNKIHADSQLTSSSVKSYRQQPTETSYPTRVLKSQNSSDSVLVH